MVERPSAITAYNKMAAKLSVYNLDDNLEAFQKNSTNADKVGVAKNLSQHKKHEECLGWNSRFNVNIKLPPNIC